MLSELLDLLPSHVKVSVLLCVKGGRLNIVRGSFCKEFAVMRSAKQDRNIRKTGSQGLEKTAIEMHT